MCEKCDALDEKIEHYKRIADSITDQTTLDRIKNLVGQLGEQKAALHPEKPEA
jgi:hypothetical protein